MTLQELIIKINKQYKDKYHSKEVGDAIALSVYTFFSGDEIYFIDCGSTDSNLTDDQYNSLLQCKVESYSMHQNYGGLAGKLILRVEVL